MNQRFIALLATTYLSSIVGNAAASAQQLSAAATPGGPTAEQVIDQAADAAEQEEREIVVTGTLLRGVAPVGAETLAIQPQAIIASGAANSSDLLARIPQAGTFNTEPAIRGQSGSSISINRPILRNLGNPAASASSTLLLLDGHRLPGMGVTQTGPDIDAIPTGAIERVEIVPDGGSATYGSDAIGGVVNFITRKRFDGVSARARYGFADAYHQFDSNLTVGKDWGLIAAYVSYDYVRNDKIYGRDRDYFTGLDYTASQTLGRPVATDTSCQPGNIRVGTTFYALPGLTTDALNLGNRCDLAKTITVYPSQVRHSVLSRIAVGDGGPVSFDVTGFYMHRTNVSDAGPLRNTSGFTVQRRIGNQTTGALNPFYMPVVPGSVASETVFNNFSTVFGNSSFQTNKLETYGVTPTLRVDLGSKWQVSAFGNYGKGIASFAGEILNPTPISTAIAAGTFNPFDLTAATNAAVLATARDWINYARGENQLVNGRAVIEGPLFRLPGGEVRIAAGGEYSREKFDLTSRNGVTAAGISALPSSDARRTVRSVFGEINVPIIGADNRGFLYSLSLNAAGRYDKYSDFGDTFNPQFGITLEPAEGVTLRGKYGKSFQAPSLNDIAGATVSSANIIGSVPAFFANSAIPALTGQSIIFFGGTILPLQPQTAKTLSVGIDLRPKQIPGFAVGATYYKIKFRNLIDSAPIGQSIFYPNYPDQYRIYTQGLATMQSYLDMVRSLVSNPAILPTSAANVYAILDQRRQNLAGVLTDGLDVYLRYRHPTGFGAVYVDFNGNALLNFKRQLSQSSPFVEIRTGSEVARIRTTTSLGAEVGGLRGEVTWNYQEGYPIDPISYGPGLAQTHVKSYNLFNAFLQYTTDAKLPLVQDLAFTLNVDNVFDKDPPLFRSSQNFANGQTLGRVVKFGVSGKF